jgi:hypothetical protein
VPRMFILIALGGALAGCRARDSVELRLENVGAEPLESLVVYTTGREYEAGRLDAGQSTHLMIGANGESHIEIEHGIGERRRLRVGTYFESGYGGSITVHLRADSVVAVFDSIKI